MRHEHARTLASRATATLKRMRLAVGTVVAYPPHGVGRIVGRERKVVLGVEQEIVAIDLADGLLVTLPLTRARELLRPPVDEAALRRVRETLREDGALSDQIWSKRLKELQEKLRHGDPQELAAIVRDGARRDRAPTANGPHSKLSVSERALCTKARELLSGEIGLVRGLDQAEADAWIDEQLAPLSS
jgi:RNA polymerase-interacting CarD/CdnL/TRCF family regulator